jgi:hypothetical protein
MPPTQREIERRIYEAYKYLRETDAYTAMNIIRMRRNYAANPYTLLSEKNKNRLINRLAFNREKSVYNVDRFGHVVGIPYGNLINVLSILHRKPVPHVSTAARVIRLHHGSSPYRGRSRPDPNTPPRTNEVAARLRRVNSPRREQSRTARTAPSTIRRIIRFLTPRTRR